MTCDHVWTVRWPTLPLPAEGWHHHLSDPAPDGVLLEWGRYSTHWHWRTITQDIRAIAEVFIELHPEHLYWRWTGIGREQVAAAQTSVHTTTFSITMPDGKPGYINPKAISPYPTTVAKIGKRKK